MIDTIISDRFRYKNGFSSYGLSKKASLAKQAVEKKIKEGIYKFEDRACFCGSGNSVILADRDRYGLYYSFVICKKCGLMRANPRLTKDSYEQFYTNGTILYRNSILRGLDDRSSGFFFQTDILVRATKKGYLFAEVPYRLGLRKEGISSAISFPSLLQVMKEYLRLVKYYYFKRGRKAELSFSEDSLTAIRRKNRQWL